MEYYVYVYLDNTKQGNFTYGRLTFTAEPFYIGIKLIGRRDLGRGPLSNLTDGGEGTTNRIYSDAERAAITERIKNMWKVGIWDNRDITGDRNGFYGKHHTEETKDKIRANIGNRKGKNNGNYGKTWSDEQIAAACFRQKKNHEHLTGDNNPAKRLEIRQQLSENKIGLKNPMASRWELISPDGDRYIIDGGIHDALKKYGLTYMKMCSRKVGCTFRSISGWRMWKINTCGSPLQPSVQS